MHEICIACSHQSWLSNYAMGRLTCVLPHRFRNGFVFMTTRSLPMTKADYPVVKNGTLELYVIQRPSFWPRPGFWAIIIIDVLYSPKPEVRTHYRSGRVKGSSCRCSWKGTIAEFFLLILTFLQFLTPGFTSHLTRVVSWICRNYKSSRESSSSIYPKNHELNRRPKV